MPPLLGGFVSMFGIGSRSTAAVSDDEASDLAVEEEVEAPVKKSPKKKLANQDPEPIEDSVEQEDVEIENDDVEVDDDEAGEGEFIVEDIRTHLLTEEGVIMFQVKWEGYEKRSDLTWEPEDNLRGSADEILKSYLERVGGRESILDGSLDDVEKGKKTRGRKRGRASITTATPDNRTNSKKARKESSHPASSTPPASKTKAIWAPPTGSWEDDVREISACEGTDGEINVYLTWNSGHRTQHSLEQIYKRCPQKMLKFYERHLSFTPVTDTSEQQTDVRIESSKRGRGRPRKINP